MDDVIYVGMPSCEEHLNSKYLVFETNCDGDAETYLSGLAEHVPEQVEAIWQHCVGYPKNGGPGAFVRYMKACQLETTFFFAAVNDRTVAQTLLALQTQRGCRLCREAPGRRRGRDPAGLPPISRDARQHTAACAGGDDAAARDQDRGTQ